MTMTAEQDQAAASGGRATALNVEPLAPPDADVVVITDEGFDLEILMPIFVHLREMGFGVKHIGINRQG